MILLIIVFGILFVLFIYHLLTKKYLNPYKLHMYIGSKGSGKSTLMTKMIVRDLKNGKIVYSNFEVKFRDKKSNKEYSTKDLNPIIIHKYKFEPNTSIYIDEVNTYWDNRNFRNMDPDTIMWFRYQRHYKCKVILFSQTFDIDRKLRGLTDEFHVVRKYMRCLVFSRRLIMKPVVVHPEGDAPARIADDFIEDTPIFAIFGGIQLAWIPHWVHLFDSFSEYEPSSS